MISKSKIFWAKAAAALGLVWWNNVDGKEGHALPETFMRRKHVVRCVANKERWASLLGISVPDYCWLICIEKL